jgi:hypothetical protein
MGKIILYLGVWAEKLFVSLRLHKGCRVSISAHRRVCRPSTVVRARPGQPSTYPPPGAIGLQEWTWQVLPTPFYKPLEYSTVTFLISPSIFFFRKRNDTTASRSLYSVLLFAMIFKELIEAKAPYFVLRSIRQILRIYKWKYFRRILLKIKYKSLVDESMYLSRLSYY